MNLNNLLNVLFGRTGLRLEVDKEARKFILITAGASLSTWNIAFELGVWGEIFYARLFSIWVLTLAVVLSIFFLPQKRARFSLLGKFVLAFPTGWLLLTLVNERMVQLDALESMLYAVGIFIAFLCLPYLIYVLVSLLDEEPLALERRLYMSMILIVSIVGLTGFFIGLNHHLFLTCQDFALSGEYLPENCVKS